MRIRSTLETKCQIHARESRKQFTPLDHWLMKSELNGITQFADSVVAEEEEYRNADKGVGAKLAILHNIPFVIPFEDRVYIFRRFVLGDKAHLPAPHYFGPLHGAKAIIRRDHIFEDGYDHLNRLGSGLKSRVAITFIDQFGLEEAGIDGGGVFKEFLTGLARQAFDTDYGLFLNTVDQKLYPNPHAFAQEDTQLGHYEFLGRIMGKALYEGILVDVAFAGFFLSKLLGRLNFLDDLPTLDPELYRGLIYLKNCDKEEVQNLSLTFTVISDELGAKRELELIPGGSKIPVTLENRIEYIYRVANYRLNDQIYKQCRAFFRGLTDLIEPNWLKMFNQQELQVLLGGAQVPIDLVDLKSNIVYEGKYFESHPVIRNFWEVVHEFQPEEREKLVKFITSCSRPPLLGFKELSPKMCITSAGEDDSRLPTSSTCVNLLKLPQFSTKAILREKLKYAINSEAGFDLS
ncbi:HECT-domain-containing protein [Basidiobolus meristosporus CBS 931.73]|uniref:HECT-type E3 ubiquitin transferase n=1 Tax=Basidiobolus meristosporus CBS 931.73 TaxID=1314790 RepID=A0A1Y1XTH8_9FUNG|nr:HECT-domain-containing protein [Basidiobolus meristosporus CBS 931.73]|eukprot:ORX89040.1 HECT-domain-containing protein [Basidiobolus meristosporus CBS 931.73]